jgi:hypothetical protein
VTMSERKGGREFESRRPSVAEGDSAVQADLVEVG